MFTFLETVLLSFAAHMPLAIFAPVVYFMEELIPPIPSPSVMLATGSMAQIQGYPVQGLVILAILGAVGKTFGAGIIYWLADKIEDLLMSKVSKFIGITHEQVEAFGKRLGNGWKDYVVLVIVRALPMMPSSLVSIGSGLLKIDFKLYIVSTFFGSIIRAYIYIYIGYIGTTVVASFLKNTSTSIESYIQILAVILCVGGLGYLYYRRKKNSQAKM